MGSWNDVCFMSGLPIHCSEPIYAFVLMPRAEVVREGAVCYKDDKYVPIGFPIKGVYNDYGGIEDIEYPKVLETLFQSYHYLIERTDEDYNDIFVDYKWASMEQFLDHIAARKMFIKTYDGETHRLALTMIHKELYDILLYEVSNRIPYDYQQTIRELIDKKVRRHICKTAENRKRLVEKMGPNGIYFARFTDTYFQGNTTYLFMNKLVDEYLDHGEECIVKGLVDYMMWMKVMNLTNKGYLCHITGSQDEEFRLLHIIAEFILSQCTKREIECLENDDVETGTDVLAETLYFWDK